MHNHPNCFKSAVSVIDHTETTKARSQHRPSPIAISIPSDTSIYPYATADNNAMPKDKARSYTPRRPFLSAILFSNWLLGTDIQPCIPRPSNRTSNTSHNPFRPHPSTPPTDPYSACPSLSNISSTICPPDTSGWLMQILTVPLESCPAGGCWPLPVGPLKP